MFHHLRRLHHFVVRIFQWCSRPSVAGGQMSKIGLFQSTSQQILQANARTEFELQYKLSPHTRRRLVVVEVRAVWSLLDGQPHKFAGSGKRKKRGRLEDRRERGRDALE